MMKPRPTLHLDAAPFIFARRRRCQRNDLPARDIVYIADIIISHISMLLDLPAGMMSARGVTNVRHYCSGEHDFDDKFTGLAGLPR